MNEQQQELFLRHALPPAEEMYEAFVNRDPSYEGVFWTGVTTTGIFCRPECTARKPKRENVVFFRTRREALENGYRPCKICGPMLPKGEYPQWLAELMKEIDGDPDRRFTDADIRERGIDPNRLRRWFKKQYGMTFQAYLRLRRLGRAFGQIQNGGTVIDTAFDAGFESLSGFTEAFKKAFGFSPAVSSTGTPVITLKRLLTPLGPMLAGSISGVAEPDGDGLSSEQICLLEFVERRMLETQLGRLRKLTGAAFAPGESALLDRLRAELDEYFAGKGKEFTVPLLYAGTPFQEEVWRGLTTIPYGETRSYGEQAEALEKPKAVRAVAKANGDNRISIIIPCHRVIGADGSLTGYGGGIWRKRYLLDLERGGVKRKKC
jgi:AraC family transcriptional regulator, regulatory protein of adaptative response / methylated-DNA-[protein]-cysteine methyltransferase